MRKKIIAGNWKMNKNHTEALDFVNKIKDNINTDKVDVVISAPFICLTSLKDALKNTNIKLASQNMHYEESGAFTGEISANMLKEAGVSYVLIGHSERRIYFKETDEIINKKLIKALSYDITPILCVGETLEERELDITIEIIKIQIKKGLYNVLPKDAKNVVIAYEPVWAIGTGKVATKEQAQEVCKEIRDTLKEMYGEDISKDIRIQYGGSVTKDTARELFNMPDIDGGLVGGASLKEEFISIVNYDM